MFCPYLYLKSKNVLTAVSKNVGGFLEYYFVVGGTIRLNKNFVFTDAGIWFKVKKVNPYNLRKEIVMNEQFNLSVEMASYNTMKYIISGKNIRKNKICINHN